MKVLVTLCQLRAFDMSVMLYASHTSLLASCSLTRDSSRVWLGVNGAFCVVIKNRAWCFVCITTTFVCVCVRAWCLCLPIELAASKSEHNCACFSIRCGH